MADAATNTQSAVDWLADQGIAFETDVSLGPLTWFEVGGSARVVAHPADEGQLSDVLAFCHAHGHRVYMLGSGANLLVRDRGVDGVVLRLDAEAFTRVDIDGTVVTAAAGADMAALVMTLARAGLSGLECMAGIPASVGGAIRMNAGGAFGEIGPAVASVRVMENDGRAHDLPVSEIAFGYRRCSISSPVILSATFSLTAAAPDLVRDRVKEVFAYKKASQPLAAKSAGCTFKNPPIAGVTLPPDIPQPGGDTISAGLLIDRAGLKGHRIGGAEVSDRHANFIVTHPGCKADDVLALIEHVQQAVADRFGVALEREVVVWP